MPDDTATFECNHCQASFRRQEHLTRHIRTHTSERPYACEECGKTFSRVDTLSRHSASHRNDARLPSGPLVSNRACKECATSRVRCSRTAPCQRCTERKIRCDYPTTRKRKASSIARPIDQTGEAGHSTPPACYEDVGSPVTTSDGQRPISLDCMTNEEITLATQAVASPNSQSQNMPNAIGNTLMVHTAALDEAGVAPDAFPNATSSSVTQIINEGREQHVVGDSLTLNPDDFDSFTQNPQLAGQEMAISSINWISPQYQAGFDWIGELPAFAFGEMDPAIYSLPLQPTAASAPLQQQPDISTIAVLQPIGENRSATREPERVPSIARLMPSPSSSDCVTESVASNVAEGTYYVEGTAARTSFKGRSHRRQSILSAPAINSPSESSTPITSDSTKSGHPWGGILSPSSYKNLLRAIQSISLFHRHGWDPSVFPALAQAQALHRLYFQYFHPAYPFLNQYFSVHEEANSWILCLAILAVGSIYSTGPESHQTRIVLFSLLRTALSQPMSPEKEPVSQVPLFSKARSNYVELPVIQAAILNVVCVLGSANGSEIKEALVERNHLVEACRDLELLTTPQIIPPDNQVDMEYWLESQSRIRTGLMIWLIDCIFMFQFGYVSLLQLCDLSLTPLPSRDDPTTNKVAADVQISVTVLEAVQMLYMEKKLPPGLGNLSTTVLIYAILRRTKEASSQYQTELTFWNPTAKVQQATPMKPVEETWPPALPVISRWRNSACDCLDILHWNVNGIIGKSGGWEPPVVIHLHLSRLLLLTPTEHLQVLATEALVSPAFESAEASKAKRHILQWALRDQFKARLSVIHAGALLWHVRRYSSGNFLEPFGILMAVLVVWAYSTSVNVAKQHPQSLNGEGSPGSDSISSPQPQVAELEADPEPTFLHLDRPCDDEMVQLYVRLGHKMSGHLSKVGDITLPGAPRKILQQGVHMLLGHPQDSPRNDKPDGEAVPEAPLVWGMERPGADLLNALIQSMKSP